MSDYSLDYRAGMLAGTLLVFHAVKEHAKAATGNARAALLMVATEIGRAVDIQEQEDPEAAEVVRGNLHRPAETSQ